MSSPKASEPRNKTKQARSEVKNVARERLKRQHAPKSKNIKKARDSDLPIPAPVIASQHVEDHEDGDSHPKYPHPSNNISQSFTDNKRLNLVQKKQTASDTDNENPIPNSHRFPNKERPKTVINTKSSEDEDSLEEEDSPEGEPADNNQSLDLASYFPDEELPDLVVEKIPVEEVAPGRRIVDFQHVLSQMKQLGSHGQKCTNGEFQLVKELRQGLASSFSFQCFACGRLETMNSERASARVDINDALVWGAMSVGITHHHAQQLLEVLDVPIVSKPKWDKHKDHVKNIVDPRNLCDAQRKDSQKTSVAQSRKTGSKITAEQKKPSK